MRKSAGPGGAGREVAGLGPQVPAWPLSPQYAYPGGAAARGLPAPGAPLRAARAWGREEGGGGGGGAGAGPVRAARGRAAARGLAGPVSAAPCRSAGGGRRGARGGRAAAGKAALALGCAGLGAGRAAGRKPWAAAARGAKAGKGRGSCQRAAGRSGGETSSSCPGPRCTSLSFSLAHSLTSWLEIPTDVERADRQTDTRLHAAGAGGGVAAGGGESPRFWGRPGPRAQLGSGAPGRCGAEAGERADGGRDVRGPASLLRVPGGAPGAPRAGADGDAP